jgi:phytoene synthase
MVKSHDPAGYVPGKLLPTKDMRDTYYAVRSFWVETGLRFGTTAKVPPNSSPAQHLEWWQQGINDHVFGDTSTGNSDEWNHPTLNLLKRLVQNHGLSKTYFDSILEGRRADLDLKQYKTLDDLVRHAEASCGSLSKLVLESGHISMDSNSEALQAARLVGVCHGLTNALRLSIPVISTTGKLIVPEDLCVKYGVKSPRYLLSALGQGDAECRRALQHAIEDISNLARSNLQGARELRSRILSHSDGDKAVAVLIPGVASEVFLDRLERTGYDLTDRNLRNVGVMERALCIGRMYVAFYRKMY